MRLEVSLAVLVVALTGCSTGPNKADEAAMVSMIDACAKSVPDPRGTGSAQFQACVYDLSEKYRQGKYGSAPKSASQTTRCQKDIVTGGFICTTE